MDDKLMKLFYLTKDSDEAEVEKAEKYIEEVQDTFKALSKKLNIMGGEDKLAEVMFQCILNDHRTLQQSFFRVIFKIIQKYSMNMFFDGRNQASVVACKNIVSNINLGLPIV